MAKLTLKTTDNPKLMTKPIANGKMQSLYLDYYLGRRLEIDPVTGEGKEKVKRKRQYLNLRIYTNPTTPIERNHNDETLRQAEIMREDARREYLNGKGFAFEVEKKKDVDFWSWEESYRRNYSKRDYRVINSALFGFREYLRSDSKCKGFATTMSMQDITPELCSGFAEYLMNTHKGEGATTYWQRFHKVISVAVSCGLIEKDPCTGIQVMADSETITRKEILTEEEAVRLMQCHNDNLNQDVKRAFLFSMYTGMRFCDVQKLTWANIDTERKVLEFVQSKTKHSSKKAKVTQPLRDDVLTLAGEQANKDSKVFPMLPTTSNGANYALEDWMKSAGIKKHITWHCARHTFCTYAVAHTKDFNTVAALAGHSSPQITMKRYAHVLQEQERNVLNSLQPIVTNKEEPAAEGKATEPQHIDISRLTPEQAALLQQLVNSFRKTA